jgi:hypothetical protein
MPLGPRNLGPSVGPGPRLNPNPTWPFWVKGPPELAGATGGANIFNQDLTATVNLSASFQRQANKLITATIVLTASILRAFSSLFLRQLI